MTHQDSTRGGQAHGLAFEDLVKASLFPGASNHARGPTSLFDVEGVFDRELGLPTSIKSAKRTTEDRMVIPLSDARRWWAMEGQSFWLIVGGWRQDRGEKIFALAHQFLITPEVHRRLVAGIKADEVEAFHEGLRAFMQGSHAAARAWARQRRASLPFCITRLNPKVDSKNQRRLQCSLSVDDLRAAIEDVRREIGSKPDARLPLARTWTQRIGTLSMPLRVISPPRRLAASDSETTRPPDPRQVEGMPRRRR